MLKRRLQDLTYCISYNVNFLNDKAHGCKNFRRQYTVIKELARGGFGIVYKAERKEDGAPVAVKFIEHKRVREWTMKCKQLIPTEICLLEICRDIPGVVRLIDWFANSKGFLLVMERPEQCMDLFDIISVYGHLDELVAQSLFQQLLRTVCQLYSRYGIFHRDIKDENVIVDMQTGQATLVDFGAAAFITETCANEFQGTRLYCPPEWFKRLVYMPHEATVWSLGVVLYAMVSGNLPFQNEIQICLGRLIIPKHISKDCKNLLQQCLVVIPEKRINLTDIQKHKWLTESQGALPVESFRNIVDRRGHKKAASTARPQHTESVNSQTNNLKLRYNNTLSVLENGHPVSDNPIASTSHIAADVGAEMQLFNQKSATLINENDDNNNNNDDNNNSNHNDNNNRRNSSYDNVAIESTVCNDNCDDTNNNLHNQRAKSETSFYSVCTDKASASNGNKASLSSSYATADEDATWMINRDNNKLDMNYPIEALTNIASKFSVARRSSNQPARRPQQANALSHQGQDRLATNNTNNVDDDDASLFPQSMLLHSRVIANCSLNCILISSKYHLADIPAAANSLPK